jgi:moderate conductance mechanosensitive channel
VNEVIGINTTGLGEIIDPSAGAVRHTGAVLAQQSDGNDLQTGIDAFLTSPLLAIAVIAVAAAASRLVRLAILVVLRRMSRRGLERPTSWWRTRMPRALSESREQAESRRQQRIAATGRMLGHLVSVVIWIAAILAALQILGVDPLLVLTSAGFLGAALAFGGQNVVKDYLAGLTVLLEDRYGVGDHVTVSLDGVELYGTVDHLGAFSTRINDSTTTWHLANTSLVNVRNHDQAPATTELLIAAPPAADRAALAHAVSDAVERAAGNPFRPDTVLVDEVATDIERTGEHPVVRVSVRTPRPMGEHERERLRRVVEAQLAHRERRPPRDQA